MYVALAKYQPLVLVLVLGFGVSTDTINGVKIGVARNLARQLSRIAGTSLPYK